ncbi:MAG: HlyD family efflux transporter periplasmic adaptor subunit [Clostridiaceae bacterium]|nr:HlyD family efflux transporter periplasmic adaptor subunit [Clostridiaceae bacterium]
MKLGNRLAMLGAALLLLLFFVYLGFQVTQNLSEQTVTVDAVEVTVEDKLSAEGTFLRDQVNVYGGSGGSAEYLVDDGEKVSVGQTIAIFFDNASSLKLYRECEDLQNRLSALKYARDNISSGADSLKMDELIRRQIASLNSDLADGQSGMTDEGYARLRQLIISRSASKDDETRFDEAVSDLESELLSKKQQLGSGSGSVSSPVSGYFLSFCDGYETVLTAAAKDTLSPDEILSAPAQPDPAAIGTVTDEFSWYFAAVATTEEADAIRNRTAVTVYFPDLSSSPIEVELVSVRSCGDGRAVLVLRSGVMDISYLEARRQPVDLVLGSYTGLKVPKDALRQQDGIWGVYVLDGAVARFKPVTWSYQTESYYLVPCADSAKDGLYRHDKIILRAKDLADNKVLG